MPRRHRDDSAASRKYHNRVARQYDAIYDDRYWEFHDELTWRAIKPHLPKSTSSPCLDLGCGTGKWGSKLLKSGFATTFVDHSPNMIEQARAKVESLGPRAKHASFLVADIIDLRELPSDHFGLAVAMGDRGRAAVRPAEVEAKYREHDRDRDHLSRRFVPADGDPESSLPS